jgi:2-polyprenyl-3-methyl-5-hydroxy-6-metoxy-1,4-benzoquinol methylase
VGVEPNRALAEYASTKFQLAVEVTHYTADVFPPHSFDVVTMIQTLEHFPRPRSALEAALAHLRPGGVIVVEVPSVRAPHFLLYRATRYKGLLKPSNGLTHRHVSYFSPSTLDRLAGDVGFRCERIVTGRWRYRYDGALRIAALAIDPVLNAFRLGGILYVGRKPE